MILLKFTIVIDDLQAPLETHNELTMIHGPVRKNKTLHVRNHNGNTSRKSLNDKRQTMETYQGRLKQQNMSVTVVMLNTAKNAVCNCGELQARKYALQHGYNFHVQKELIQHKEIQHVKFQKYYEVLQNFDSTLVLLLDCDVIITNHSIRVETIYGKYNNDIIIARDPQWKRLMVPINSGIIVFKNSKWTLHILNQLAYSSRLKTHQYLSDTLVDQPVLTNMLAKSEGNALFARTEFVHTAHVSIVSSRVMNSILRKGVDFFKTDDINSIWTPGDWAVHITGSVPSVRQSILQEMKNNNFVVC